METIELFKQYLEHLFAGRRSQARELIFDAHDRGFGADKLLSLIIWPAMEQINKLYREHHISKLTEHLAMRINRMIAAQMQSVLNKIPKNGKRILIACGDSEQAELGGQIASDLFEAEGWSVWFIGSGVANDEIVKFANQNEPDLFMIYSSNPNELPAVRNLIRMFRELGICPEMQIMFCGGVFNRAFGLHEEMKADLHAKNIREALCVSYENAVRVVQEEKPQPGRRRRKRKHVSSRMESLRDELLNNQAEPQKESRIDKMEQLLKDLTSTESDNTGP